MKFLGFNKVLCLSPHPDDVELGMLGTIQKYRETRFDVLCLTRGGAKDFDPSNGTDRRSEVLDVWEEIGAGNAFPLFSNVEYFEDKNGDAEWINYIETEFLKEGGYEGIFVPSGEDSMYEHRFVNKLGPPLTRVTPLSLIEYRTVSTLNSWIPGVFVDIKEYYGKKEKSLQKFASQLNKSYFSKDSVRAFHTNFQCTKKGISFTEQFKLLQLFK